VKTNCTFAKKAEDIGRPLAVKLLLKRGNLPGPPSLPRQTPAAPFLKDQNSLQRSQGKEPANAGALSF
jgi:hypothetical protein